MIAGLPEGFHLAFKNYGSEEGYKEHLDQITVVERAYVDLFRNERRRRASAAARAACRSLLLNLGHDDWQVVPDEYGAPHFVTVPKGEPVRCANISLTHGHGLAAALLSEKGGSLAVGLDLEAPRPSILKTLDDFYTEEERQQIRARKPKESVLLATRIWAAREAVLKVLGMGFGANAQSVSISVESEHRGQASVRGVAGLPEEILVKLRFGFIEEMVVCVAWVDARDLAIIRDGRPAPRRDFPWTNFKTKMFDSNQVQHGGIA